MLAGRDTTAILMSWAVHELITHPAAEATLLAELDTAYAYRQPSHDATTLPYLQAVIQETLRLHPSVPMDFKVCTASHVHDRQSCPTDSVQLM